MKCSKCNEENIYKFELCQFCYFEINKEPIGTVGVGADELKKRQSEYLYKEDADWKLENGPGGGLP